MSPPRLKRQSVALITAAQHMSREAKKGIKIWYVYLTFAALVYIYLVLKDSKEENVNDHLS